MQTETAAAATDYLLLSQDVRVLTGELRNVVQALEESNARGNTQTVIHKTSGGNFIAGFAVAACIAVLGITYEANSNTRERIKELTDRMRDASAWIDVMRGKIATLEGKLNGAKP